ncbi:hypothetical protein NDN08_006454 [Rhodosorus marinus]|uniref:Uncharacterized protein n=1 Tax=Rhodosorus marinus TaxID=101924 RepID=A0AAV8UHS2_9RHOD|nr:hypothetical protein NDN08_006454 [Rhodosorus marinus]
MERPNPSRFAQASPRICGRKFLVTGTGSGIGKVLCDELHRLGGIVIALHGPHTDAPRTASDAYGCDFTSVEQIRATGATVAKRHSDIDVLVHCAGVMFPKALNTEDGLETTIQVNSIAPFILTEALQTGLVRPPRALVFLSSEMHRCFPICTWRASYVHTRRSRYHAYALSKLCAHALLGRRSDAETNLFVHPGVVDTALYENETGILGSMVRFVQKLSFWSPEYCVRELLAQAIGPSLGGDLSGKYDLKPPIYLNLPERTSWPLSIPDDEYGELHAHLARVAHQIKENDHSASGKLPRTGHS